MATHVSLCDRAALAVTLPAGGQSWDEEAWGFHRPPSLPGAACVYSKNTA